MKLNHINLTVTDVLAAEAFLVKYCGMRSERTPKDNKNFGVVFDDDWLVLTLMKNSRNAEVNYPDTFHIGFGQATEADVDALYERLRADGFAVEPPQRAHAWTFYVDAPGGFRVEIMA